MLVFCPCHHNAWPSMACRLRTPTLNSRLRAVLAHREQCVPACRVFLQEAVNSFGTIAQQALLGMRCPAVADRLPTSAALLEALKAGGTAFTSLMKLMRSHDSNQLVFQAAVRCGGKLVDHFLKVSSRTSIAALLADLQCAGALCKR